MVVTAPVATAYMERCVRLRDALRHDTLTRAGVDLRPLWRGQALERWADAPMTLRRARALEAVLDQVALPLRDEDLLVGSPSGCMAPALPAGVDQASYERYRALNAGIGERSFITGFDHLAPDYAHLLAVGLPGLLDEVRASQARHSEAARRTFLDSVAITLAAAIRYVARWAAACRERAVRCANAARRAELQRMAADLDALTHGAPHSFSQALQLVWLVHTIYCIEGRGAMAFGRMDQYLLPFYRAAVEEGEGALAHDLMACMWSKLEDPLIPNPVQNIAIGGQTRDGNDASNALTYLILQVTGEVGTPRSNLSARVWRGSPRGWLEACCDLIKTGIGFPALFNDEVLVPALVDLGVALEDARDYALVGCIETFLPGQMPPWSDSRFNLLQCVDRALRNGVDGLDGVQRGPATGAPQSLATFDAFMDAFRAQVRHMAAQHCAAINALKQLPPDDYTSPFLSALTNDCVARGLDISAGGARSPDLHGPAGMGLGSTADALAAIRWFVYDQRSLTWEALLGALDANLPDEALRQRLLHDAPKYGNDDPYVDALAADVARTFTHAVLAQRTPSGGRHVPLMAANVSNIAAGKEVGATPDGRRALEPLSDAASPTFGRDRLGPTAVLSSLARVDYRPAVGGTVVNVKFSPHTLDGPEGTAVLRTLVETYFARGGMQLQFNVTGRETLEAARAHPAEYRDLVVRVSGFSALYVELSDEVQRDILARSEH